MGAKLCEDQLSRLLLNVDLLNFVNSHEQGINMILDNRGEDLPLGIHARELVTQEAW